MDDDFAELELLSLVSKVTSELQNHLGISEKTLAEFIIAKRLECSNFSEFKSKLAELGGASWPESLIESIDRLVRTMHPKFKAEKEAATEDHHKGRTLEEKETLFKGLSIPDKEFNGGDGDDIDETLALLEGLEDKARSARPERSSRKRSRSPEREDGTDSRHRRRERYRSRDRRDKAYDDDDEYMNGRREHKSRRDERDEYRSYRNGQRERRRKYDDEDNDNRMLRNPPQPEVDDSPILYKVYDGHVTGIREFGAFVNLHGVKGKVDGMVHISNLAQGQRDVDQETGMDLAPQARIQSGANNWSRSCSVTAIPSRLAAATLRKFDKPYAWVSSATQQERIRRKDTRPWSKVRQFTCTRAQHCSESRPNGSSTTRWFSLRRSTCIARRASNPSGSLMLLPRSSRLHLTTSSASARRLRESSRCTTSTRRKTTGDSALSAKLVGLVVAVAPGVNLGRLMFPLKV
ncbi:hypothetical protein M434DRAFT_151095 [Hypoxylon sp. CO27-5]|nr:hypothetical protein M434DRAFT_151095 [Hypoxylon sp. CO27-5]